MCTFVMPNWSNKVGYENILIACCIWQMLVELTAKKLYDFPLPCWPANVFYLHVYTGAIYQNVSYLFQQNWLQ